MPSSFLFFPRRSRWPVWVVSAMLAGCAAGPDYVRPELDTPAQWRAEAGAKASASDLANLPWWQQFDDPVLNGLVQLAIQNNSDVRIAMARVQEYAARLGLARADQLPQVGSAGSAVRETLSAERHAPLSPQTPPTSAAYELSASVGWELDFWGRARRGTEAAQADLYASDEDRRALTLSIVATVADTYVRLLSLDAELALVREVAAVRESAYKWHEAKQKGGGAAAMNVLQARAQWEETLALVPQKERDIAVAENALATLIGANPSTVARARDFQALKQPAVPGGLPSDVLRQRPDVRLAEQQLVAANARIGVAKAGYFPRLSLTGLLGLASTELSRLFISDALFGHIGSQFEFSLYDGGRQGSVVDQAQAIRDRQELIYRKAVRTAFLETDDALNRHHKARERDAALLRRIDTLTELHELLRKRHEGGYSSYIDVLQAESTLLMARLERVAAQREVPQSLIQLYKALGGGWMAAAPDLIATPLLPSPAASAPAAAAPAASQAAAPTPIDASENKDPA